MAGLPAGLTEPAGNADFVEPVRLGGAGRSRPRFSNIGHIHLNEGAG